MVCTHYKVKYYLIIYIYIFFIFFIEFSTLNIFHASPDGKSVFMSTASENLPAPVFGFVKAYPNYRTSKIYSINVCEHEFVYDKIDQIRRNDEAPTVFYKCSKCGFVKMQ